MNDRLLAQPDGSDVPTLTVTSGGDRLPATWVVTSATVLHAVDRVPVARLVLRDGAVSDRGFVNAAADTLAPGASVTIEAGYRGNTAPIFEGVVTRQRIRGGRAGAASLEVVAKHPAAAMTAVRRSAHHGALSDSGLIEQLVADRGLQAEVESSSIEHDDLVQYQCSDWDLMLARAQANGMWVLVAPGGVKVARPALSSAVETLTYGATMLDVDLCLDAEQQFEAFTAASWRPADQATAESEAQDPDLRARGRPDGDELSSVLGAGAARGLHGGGLGDGELAGWADGALLRSRLMRVRGRVRSQGTAVAQPGDTVALAGLGARFDGDVLVTGICHRLADGNWTTDFAFGLEPDLDFGEIERVSAPAAGGLIPAIPGLHVARVTALEGDPAGDGRIQVRLPLIDPDAAGSWARLCAEGAGADRGRVFRPEIDDEVIVGFLDGDPRHPVVVGAVHSGANAPPVEASDDNHEKAYISREGVRWTVYEDKPALVFETPAGRTVTLDDGAGHIQLTDGDGNTVTLSSDGITLESSGDVTITAQGDVKIDGLNVNLNGQVETVCAGSASAKLTASGEVVVQGALVKIN